MAMNIFCRVLPLTSIWVVSSVAKEMLSNDGQMDATGKEETHLLFPQGFHHNSLRRGFESGFVEDLIEADDRLLTLPCDKVRMDFSVTGKDGIPLQHGDYVKDDWLDTFELTITASGGHTPDGKARVFDVSRDCATLDPGAQTEEVCRQGNVLIVQESSSNDDDDAVPNANASGGTITFTFEHPKYVTKVGLMNLTPQKETYFVTMRKADGSMETREMQGLGEKSIQEEAIEQDLTSIAVTASNSFAVRFIEFCGSGLQWTTANPTARFMLVNDDTNEEICSDLQWGVIFNMAMFPRDANLHIKFMLSDSDVPLLPNWNVRLKINGVALRLTSQAPYRVLGDTFLDVLDTHVDNELSVSNLMEVSVKEDGSNTELLKESLGFYVVNTEGQSWSSACNYSV